MLMELIYGKFRVVSVVGMAKNAGKTVVLNKLIEEAYSQYITIGLTSIGRDGEREDLVTKTEKPVIHVMEGTIIATAQDTILNADARLEILEVTGYRTTLGPIVICRVKENGLVEIAGPGNNWEIREVAKKMLLYGVDVVLVDGAINRKTAASPEITEATILSTGAVVSRSIDRVLEETAHQVELFGLEKVEDPKTVEDAKRIMEKGVIALIDESGEIRELSMKTALNAGRIIGSALKEGTEYVIFPGSLVRKTLEELIAVTPLYKKVTFVVHDGTKIFISYDEWIKLKRRGITVQVIEPINVLAVSVNPYAPKGYEFQPEEFHKKMKELLRIPVIDVMLQGEDLYE